MADLPTPLSDQPEEVYRRLLDGDPTAPDDLATLFLEPLIGWLSEHNRGLPDDLVTEAAGDAILALIRNPASYKPEKRDLEGYLRMSAQGDLKNRLRSEQRHRTGRQSLASVEQSDRAGKYLSVDDDPSFRLQVEEGAVRKDSLPESVREGLSEGEQRALDLYLQKVRPTSEFAEALGITHLAPDEQRRQVKQTKDRLQKRIDRAGGNSE